MSDIRRVHLENNGIQSSLMDFQKNLLSFQKFQNQTGVDETILTAIPIRELKKARQELALQTAKTQYSSKLATLGEMAGGMAHEINNPLSIISGYNQRISKIIQKGESNLRSVVGLTEHIESNVQRIASIVQRLLRFTRSTEIKTTLIEVDPISMPKDSLARNRPNEGTTNLFLRFLMSIFIISNKKTPF